MKMLLVSALLASSFGFAGQKSLEKKLKSIQAEKSKIQAYINDGNNSSELKEVLNRYNKQERELKSKIKKLKKHASVKKVKKVSSHKHHKNAPIYNLDLNADINDQYQKVLKDLDTERSHLSRLNDSIENGLAAEILEKPIQRIERKISAIESHKVRIERHMAKSRVPASSHSNIEFGAMIDAYYMYNFNGSDGNSTNYNYNARNNDFTLNLFELNAKGSYNKVGFYAELDFGPFATQNENEEVDVGEKEEYNLAQAYLTYEKNGYTFSLGKMYTNVGFEVAKAQDNWNYSRSYTFSLTGPFWHEGISLTKSYDSGFGWGFYVYDSWDKRESTDSDKTYSLQLNYSNDKFGFITNYITGKDKDDFQNKSVLEFNSTMTAGKYWTFALNGVQGTHENAGLDSNAATADLEWMAYAFYAHYKKGGFALTPRFEKIDYTNKDGQDTDLQSMTLTAGFDVDTNSEVRLEFRQDKSSEKEFEKDGVANSKDSQSTASVSWLLKI